MYATKVIAVILTVVTVTTAVPQFHTFETRYGNDIVAREEIEVDKEANILLATITPIKGNLIQTVNLHDFVAGFTAIKDEQRETCYVLKLSHTLHEMMDKFEQSLETKGFFDVSTSFACTKKQFIPTPQVGKYGERIARFCQDHDVVYSEKNLLNRKRRSLSMMSGESLICGICIFANCSERTSFARDADVISESFSDREFGVQRLE